MRSPLASVLATILFWSPLIPSRVRAQDAATRRVEAADYADRDPSLYRDVEEEPAAVAASRELGPAASPDVLERGSAEQDDSEEVDTPAVPADETTGEGDLSSNPLDLPSGPGKSAVTPQSISLPSGEGSIEGMGESFTPNLSSGTGTFSVPIAVPAGRNGVQPSLALSYSTAGGNGALGLGWGLAVPFISRQTDKELPAYADQSEWSEQEDTFMYNGGQELVPVLSEEATAVDGAPVPDEFFGWQQYRARVEGGFMRFFRSPTSEYWVVQAKDGTRFDFGLAPDARMGDPENETRVFKWSLSRMSDAHGSTVHYRYVEDGARLYLSDIYYGSPNRCASAGNPAQARECDAPFEDYGRRVHLVYQERPDVTSSYITGWRVETAWRLARIELTSHMGEVGKRYLVRRYRLSYGEDSYHSLLEAVQVEGRPSERDATLGVQVGNALVPEGDLDGNVIGELLPPMRFGYTNAATTSDEVPGFGGLNLTVRRAATSPGHGADGSRADLFDVNKDGLPDLLVTDPARFDHGAGVYFNGFDEEGTPTEAGSFSQSVRVGIPDGKAGTMRLGNVNVRPMDMDGDGQSDLVHMPPHSRYGQFFLTKARSDAGGATPVSGWNFAYTRSTLSAEETDQRIDLGDGTASIRMVDVNNDHLIDVVKTTGTDILTWLNLGHFEGGEGRFGSAEWDGTGHVLSTEPLETCLPYAGRKLGFDDPRVRLADMNGDGLQDIVFLRSSDVVYWPGRGAGVWGDGPAQCSDPDHRHTVMSDSPQVRNIDTADVRLVDVNADGASDMVLVKPHELSVWFNRGGESFTERLIAPHDGLHESSAPHLSGRVRAADLDGSGTIDIVYADADDWRWIDLMGGVRPRLLNTVDNGLGALTTLAYGSSVDDYLTDLADARTCEAADLDCFTWERSVCEGQADDCVHRAGANPVVSTVVRSMSTTDRLDALNAAPTVATTLYAYHDGYYEGIEQEFRGFGAADAVSLGDSDEPTSITRTWFHQGRRPNDIRSDRLADNPNEALKGREFLTETFDANGRYLSTKHASYTVRQLLLGRNGVGVSYAFVGSSDEFRYNVAQFAPAANTASLPAVTRQVAGQGLDEVQQVTSPGEGPNHPVPIRGREFAHLRTTIDVVDNVGNLRQQTAHGRVDHDEAITSHAVPVRVDDGATCGRTQWLWRTAETFVTGDGYNDPLGRTTNQHTACGDLRVATQQALLPDKYPSGFEFGTDERGARAYPQQSQTLIVSSSFDAWGQPIANCVGADLALAPSACLRHGSVTFDEAYGQFPVVESVRATADLDLTTSAHWDPGLGVLRSATDPNNLRSEVYYDGLGRLTSSIVPNVVGCEGKRVPTTRIHYQLTDDPVARPLSSVRTETVLDCDDPNSDEGTLEAVAFVDGLGRPRVALAEGSLNPATWSDHTGHAWLRSGLQTFTAKGQVHDAWQPDFYDGPAEPSPDLLMRPGDDVGFVSAKYDAFGRGEEVMAEDRLSRTVTRYGALDQTVCDPNDLTGPLYLRGTCARQSKDGHGRTVAQRLINGRESGGREFHYLFSYYRPDGAVTRIVRAKGDAYTERPANPEAGGLQAWVERSFIYDSLGRRIASFDPDTDNPAAASDASRTWRYLFNRAGDLAAVRDPRGCGQNFFYDMAGRLVGEQYVGCEEAQLAAEPFAGTVPANSVGLELIETEEAVHVKYLFDAYDPTHVTPGELPAGARGKETQDGELAPAGVLGLATGVWDRGHRSAIGYDNRGNPIWGKRELAVISEAGELTLASRRDDMPQIQEGPEVSRVSGLGEEIHYDTAHPYVHTATYDHAGRSERLRLPVDPDVDDAPVVGGSLYYTDHGAPASAVASLNGQEVPVIESLRYTRDGLVSETVYGDGHDRGATFSTTEYDARRRPTRMTTMRDAEPEDEPLRAALTLGAVSVVVDQSLEWGPANNLLRVYDQRLAEEWPAGHLPQTTRVRHDALYRVASVEFEYGNAEGEGTTDAATDWRDTEARHRAADPMQSSAAPMLPTMPENRVQRLKYEHDWLANMTVWNDDSHSFYERSIGNITNGADLAPAAPIGARPSALYLASDLNPANAADLGGWLEVDYGVGGNMTTMTVHARCQAAPLRTCEDPGGTDVSVRRERMREDCVCAAEQHYSYRWDELNRLSEARRFDRRDGEWVLQARQRYRYTSGNQRVIKQTLSSDDGLGTDGNGAGRPNVVLDLDSATLTELAQGDLLPTWPGRLGEADQEAPALQPSVGLFDGHRTVEFDGSNDVVEATQLGQATAYTALLVAGWDAPPVANEAVWAAGASEGAALLARGTNTFRLEQAGTVLTGGDASRGGMRVLAVRVDAAEGYAELYVDGERVDRETIAQGLSDLGGFVGCTPQATGSACFSGHLARFILYEGTLEDSELDRLQQELLARYARPRSPEPTTPAILTADPCADLGDACADLAINGSLEAGLASWVGGRTHEAEEVALEAEAADVAGGSTALRVEVQSEGGDTSYTGAQLALLDGIAAGQFARVQFDAKWLQGAKHLKVGRVGAGAASYSVEMSPRWQRYTVDVEFLAWGSNIVFSPTAAEGGPYRLQPADGVFLLDNVQVVATDTPTPRPAVRFRADRCNSIAGHLRCNDLVGRGLYAASERLHDNLSQNGDIEEGLSRGWASGEGEPQDNVVLTAESGDTPGGSGTSLHVNVETSGGDFRQTGALLTLGPTVVGNGRTARVLFDAKRINGATHLVVNRRGGGAFAAYVELSDQWQRYSVHLEALSHGASVLLFSLVDNAGDRTVSSGEFLLDNVVVADVGDAEEAMTLPVSPELVPAGSDFAGHPSWAFEPDPDTAQPQRVNTLMLPSNGVHDQATVFMVASRHDVENDVGRSTLWRSEAPPDGPGALTTLSLANPQPGGPGGVAVERGTNRAESAEGLDARVPVIVSLRAQQGGLLELFRDGVYQGATDQVGPTALGGRLGAAGLDNDQLIDAFRGRVAEFVAFDRALDDDEMAEVHAYLATRYTTAGEGGDSGGADPPPVEEPRDSSWEPVVYGATQQERIALYVSPGDYERRGLIVSPDGTTYEPAEDGRVEAQYLVAGARIVWQGASMEGAAGVAPGLEPDHRITFALTNLIQSTSAVVDLRSGELLEATTFYPNGARETWLSADDEVNGAEVPLEPVGFTGKEADTEVGLVYFGERYLVPRIGRWASPDPLWIHAEGGGEAMNAYHYVSGNLLQARDPLGLCASNTSCADENGNAVSQTTYDGSTGQSANGSYPNQNSADHEPWLLFGKEAQYQVDEAFAALPGRLGVPNPGDIASYTDEEGRLTLVANCQGISACGNAGKQYPVFGALAEKAELERSTVQWDRYGRSASDLISNAELRLSVDLFSMAGSSAVARIGTTSGVDLLSRATRSLKKGWIRSNVALRSVRTQQDRAVFWSGYPLGNKDAAQAYARSLSPNGRTVEMTSAGRWLDTKHPWDSLVETFGENGAGKLWDRVALRFSRGASGEVHSFIRGMRGTPGFQQKTYFRLEKPALLNNRRVTRIIEHE